MRNKTAEIVKDLEKLKQDIAILTETKKKGNGVVILGTLLTHCSGITKERRANRKVF
jgi:hypothetical protein